ncbi:hypothetical protein Tco_0054175 [Tanacetum coccineum]
MNGKQLWELIEGLEGCIRTVCFLDTVLEVVSKLHSVIAALTYGSSSSECLNVQELRDWIGLCVYIGAFGLQNSARVLRLLVPLLELNQFGILLGELEEGRYTLPTEGMRSIISTVSISLEGFLPSILLLVMIIVAIVIVAVILVVVVVAIVGVVIVVMIIWVFVIVMVIRVVVVVIVGVSFILKISFMIISFLHRIAL